MSDACRPVHAAEPRAAGRELTQVGRKRLQGAELIDPTARFIQRQVYYGYDGITRLELGGEYERTLAMVAGLS